MSRTLRAMPYRRVGRVKGHKAALVKKARDGAVPPSRYDKRGIKAYKHPWAIAWRMISHGHTAEEIARTLNKSYGIPFSRAVCIGKHVVRSKYEREQEALGRIISVKAPKIY